MGRVENWSSYRICVECWIRDAQSFSIPSASVYFVPLGFDEVRLAGQKTNIDLFVIGPVRDHSGALLG